MLKIKDINTLKQIIKMILIGELPNDVYDKYLSNSPIGFMNEEDLFNYLVEKVGDESE